MNPTVSAEHPAKSQATLPGLGARALSIQGLLLIAASFLLPAAAHLTGLPVRILLPMHWPVILVGLCYGWRSGAVVGLAAPVLSFALSGMPYPPMLPAMTFELAAYGLLAGLFHERFRWNMLWSAALAVVGGRVLFIGLVLATGAAGGGLVPYLNAAMIPGRAAGLAQIALLPVVARWWVTREKKR
jgi:niacin transporter